MIEILRKVLLLRITSVKPDQVKNILYDFDVTRKTSARETEIAKMLAANPDLKSWLDTTKACADFQKYINTRWIEVFHAHKTKKNPEDLPPAISNDELIPILIELIPDDLNDLKALSSKFNVIATFNLTDMASFVFTNLEAAVYHKINALEHPDQRQAHSEDPAFDAFIKTLKKEELEKESVKCNALFAPIKALGNEYKTFLLTLLTDYLKEKHGDIHKKYFDPSKNNSEPILEIHSDMQSGNLEIAKDENIKILINKCVAITLLSYQYSHNNPSFTNLISFTQSFTQQHEATFKTKCTISHPIAPGLLAATTGYVRSTRISDFFRASTIEEKFIAQATDFSQKINAENDAYIYARLSHIISAKQLAASLSPK